MITTVVRRDSGHSVRSNDSNSTGGGTVQAELEFTQITHRIAALTFPTNGVDSNYRNGIREISDKLKRNFTERYKIFNVSQKRSDLGRCNSGAVAELGWPEALAPPMDQLCAICKQVENWLCESRANIAILHCKGWRARIAVVVAAYAHYISICGSGESASEQRSMREFSERFLAVDGQPSHIRYVRYFADLLLGVTKVNASPLFLTQITFSRLFPETNVVVKIYERMKPAYTSQPFLLKSLYKLSLFSASPTLNSATSSALSLRGDVLLKCFEYFPSSYFAGATTDEEDPSSSATVDNKQQQQWQENRRLLFQCQFNTCALDFAGQMVISGGGSSGRSASTVHAQNCFGRLTFFKEELDQIFGDNSVDDQGAIELTFLLSEKYQPVQQQQSTPPSKRRVKTLKKSISPPKTIVQVMNPQQQQYQQQQPDSTHRLSHELNPCGFARVDSYENFDRAEDDRSQSLTASTDAVNNTVTTTTTLKPATTKSPIYAGILKRHKNKNATKQQKRKSVIVLSSTTTLPTAASTTTVGLYEQQRFVEHQKRLDKLKRYSLDESTYYRNKESLDGDANGTKPFSDSNNLNNHNNGADSGIGSDSAVVTVTGFSTVVEEPPTFGAEYLNTDILLKNSNNNKSESLSKKQPIVDDTEELETVESLSLGRRAVMVSATNGGSLLDDYGAYNNSGNNHSNTGTIERMPRGQHNKSPSVASLRDRNCSPQPPKVPPKPSSSVRRSTASANPRRASFAGSVTSADGYELDEDDPMRGAYADSTIGREHSVLPAGLRPRPLPQQHHRQRQRQQQLDAEAEEKYGNEDGGVQEEDEHFGGGGADEETGGRAESSSTKRVHHRFEPDLVGKDRYDPSSKCFSYVPAKSLKEHYSAPRPKRRTPATTPSLVDSATLDVDMLSASRLSGSSSRLSRGGSVVPNGVEKDYEDFMQVELRQRAETPKWESEIDKLTGDLLPPENSDDGTGRGRRSRIPPSQVAEDYLSAPAEQKPLRQVREQVVRELRATPPSTAAEDLDRIAKIDDDYGSVERPLRQKREQVVRELRAIPTPTAAEDLDRIAGIRRDTDEEERPVVFDQARRAVMRAHSPQRRQKRDSSVAAHTYEKQIRNRGGDMDELLDPNYYMSGGGANDFHRSSPNLYHSVRDEPPMSSRLHRPPMAESIREKSLPATGFYGTAPVSSSSRYSSNYEKPRRQGSVPKREMEALDDLLRSTVAIPQIRQQRATTTAAENVWQPQPPPSRRYSTINSVMGGGTTTAYGSGAPSQRNNAIPNYYAADVYNDNESRAAALDSYRTRNCKSVNALSYHMDRKDDNNGYHSARNFSSDAEEDGGGDDWLSAKLRALRDKRLTEPCAVQQRNAERALLQELKNVTSAHQQKRRPDVAASEDNAEQPPFKFVDNLRLANRKQQHNVYGSPASGASATNGYANGGHSLATPTPVNEFVPLSHSLNAGTPMTTTATSNTLAKHSGTNRSELGGKYGGAAAYNRGSATPADSTPYRPASVQPVMSASAPPPRRGATPTSQIVRGKPPTPPPTLPRYDRERSVSPARSPAVTAAARRAHTSSTPPTLNASRLSVSKKGSAEDATVSPNIAALRNSIYQAERSRIAHNAGAPPAAGGNGIVDDDDFNYPTESGGGDVADEDSDDGGGRGGGYHSRHYSQPTTHNKQAKMVNSARNYYNNDYNQPSGGGSGGYNSGSTPISNGNSVPHCSYNTSTPTKSILKRNNNNNNGGCDEQNSSWYGGESILGSKSATSNSYGKNYDDESGAYKTYSTEEPDSSDNNNYWSEKQHQQQTLPQQQQQSSIFDRSDTPAFPTSDRQYANRPSSTMTVRSASATPLPYHPLLYRGAIPPAAAAYDVEDDGGWESIRGGRTQLHHSNTYPNNAIIFRASSPPPTQLSSPGSSTDMY